MNSFFSCFRAAIAALLFALLASTSAFAGMTPIVPQKAEGVLHLKYDIEVWDLGPNARREVRELADSLVTEIRAGKNICVALEGSSDTLHYATNGDLAVKRLGKISGILRRRGIPVERMRQNTLTDTPVGERFVRIGVYPNGFDGVDLTRIEARLADLERRIDAVEDDVKSAQDDADDAADIAAAAKKRADDAWEAIDRVIDLAAGVGGSYLSQPGAFGPATFAEVRFAPDPGLPVGLVAHGGLGFLAGQPNWSVGGGIGLWGDRVGLSLQYRRILYSPYQQREPDGGLTQAYLAESHSVAVAVDARLAGGLWLRAEGSVGAGHWGDAFTEPTSGTVGGGGAGLLYKFF